MQENREKKLTLPSVFTLALGKASIFKLLGNGFAECQGKNTRQSPPFAECFCVGTRQT